MVKKGGNMKEKKIRSDTGNTVGLSEHQSEYLKTFGKVKLSDIEKIKEYIPSDPNKPLYSWVVNVSNGTVVVGDLDLILERGEAAYLPRLYSIEKINSSVGLRNLINSGDLKAVEDISEVDVIPTEPIINRLKKGYSYDAKDIIGPNPYMKRLREEIKKEEMRNAELLNKTSLGEE